MSRGAWLALSLALATAALIVIGILRPDVAGSGAKDVQAPSVGSVSAPEDAVRNLLRRIIDHDWQSAYDGLANKNEFSQSDFVRDVTGNQRGLRAYAMLDGFDVHPLNATSGEAWFRASLRWVSVLGRFKDSRDVHLVRNRDLWQVEWPLVKEAKVPPQVIPVNYLRWDVIHGAGDDWGTQDVEAPHVRIVAMHPIDRGGRVVIMGEILNEDVVPAFVTVKATLLNSSGTSLGSEDSFDKISHILLPKQTSPFRIDFDNVGLSQVDSVRMQPFSTLVPASADPVIAIESQSLHPVPDSSLTGQLVNQSGQTVSVAHVIGTFYDLSGQIIWVADEYPSRELLPQTPVPFEISVPADVSSKISSYHVIASTFIANPFQ